MLRKKVQYFAPDFGISKPFIFRFPNGFQWEFDMLSCDIELKMLILIFQITIAVMNIRGNGHTAAFLMGYLRWSVMLLEASK